MFYCLLKLLISVGLIVATTPRCKKVAMELRCLWEGDKSYRIPEGTLFVYFDRFFKPAVLELPDSVIRLRIEDTDYACISFHQVDDLRLNGVSCSHQKTQASSNSIFERDTTVAITMDQTEGSTPAAVTNSPVVKVNVTLLPILGALKTPYSINLTVVLGVSSAVVILIIVVAIVCIRKRQRRRRASGVDDSSVVEYEFPLTDRKQD